jgi:ATP-dependent RNA helicase DeaD
MGEPTGVHRKTIRLQKSFESMGLPPSILEAVRLAGYETPTAIQTSLVPLAIQGYDLVGQAQTGSGKTASFALPILARLAESVGDARDDARSRTLPRALIMVPTRELATQVAAEINKLGQGQQVRCFAIYGGVNIRTQQRQLKDGCQIVVATPGRVLDLYSRDSIDLSRLEVVVLDEADRMLDIGFRPAIERILRKCPAERQTLMLSATVPNDILLLAQRYMQKPKLICLPKSEQDNRTIDQYYFSVEPLQKYDLLVALLGREQPQQAIVFCRTKLGTERLFRRLEKSRDYEAIATLHGDMTQNARERVMKQFRAGDIRLLIATDVVGRGIDVSSVSHIINFDVPSLAEDYVHRVGRTGRMGREGVAFTFVSRDQGEDLTSIELQINQLLKRDHIEGLSIAPTERTMETELAAAAAEAEIEANRVSRYRRW